MTSVNHAQVRERMFPVAGAKACMQERGQCVQEMGGEVAEGEARAPAPLVEQGVEPPGQAWGYF